MQATLEQTAWWRRKSGQEQLRIGVSTLLVTLGAFITAIPLLWMLSTSLKEDGDVFLLPIQWLPQPIVWSNYPNALTYQPFFVYFRNSVEVTLLSVVGAVWTASLVAYAFARLRAPGKDFLFAVLLSTLMLPGEVTLVPIYLIFRWLGWLDTYRPLFVPSWFGGSAFYIFLLRQFFLTLPTELDDAAKIDGANLFGIYWRILMPLSQPALATVAVFAFFANWSNFQAPLIYLTTIEKFTLPVGLRLYLSTIGNNMHWNYLMAATLVSIIPPVLIFFISQHFFVEGAVLTGVKG
ncbi:MAG: carbohydrate ABC transporter permease [Caldilineaceae bacterium]|nr:carbohydrate ABC transporter permease [Caldilineaceae bacterium]